MKRLLLAIALLLVPVYAFGQCPGGVCPQPQAQQQSQAATSFCQVRTSTGRGSGTVVRHTDDATYILTCNHVISDNPARIVCHFADRRAYGALIVKTDPAADIAILKVRRVTGVPVIVLAEGEPVGPITAYGWNGHTSVFGRATGRPGNFGTARRYGRTAPTWTINGAAVPSGYSGCGAVDSRGQLVGVVWGSGHGDFVCTPRTPIRNLFKRAFGRKQIAVVVPQYDDHGQTPAPPQPDLPDAPQPTPADPPLTPPSEPVGCNCGDLAERVAELEAREPVPGAPGMPGKTGPRGPQGEPGEPADMAEIDARLAVILNRLTKLEQRDEQIVDALDAIDLQAFADANPITFEVYDPQGNLIDSDVVSLGGTMRLQLKIANQNHATN